MQIEIPISLGELVDKISILKIKKLKVGDQAKLKHICYELSLLEDKLESLKLEGIVEELDEIFKINLSLWEIEDKIRFKEKKKLFDTDFIELARSVYMTNDKRFELKNRINQNYGSNVKEVKSYEDYM